MVASVPVRTVVSMRVRLLVGSSVVLIWILAWIALGSSDQRQVELVASLDRAAPEWVKETLYLIDVQAVRQPSAVLSGQFGSTEYGNGRRVRILVIGDSFTYGWALADPDARWTVRLEAELEKSAPTGTFEVVTLAKPGSYAFDHAKWVQDLRSGRPPADAALDPLSVDKLSGAFDAVVLGYVNNDRFPEDGLGTWTDFGREVEVDAQRYNALLRFDEPNPYQTELDEALSELKSFAGEAPLLWAPLESEFLVAEHLSSSLQRSRELYSAAGFLPVEMHDTKNLGRAHSSSDLTVTSADSHPSEALTAAYAKDVSRAILGALPAWRIEQAEDSARAPKHPFLSGTLPIWPTFSVGTDSALISITDSSESKMYETCNNIMNRPDRRQVCDGSDQYIEIDATRYPRQAYPCALMGRPYILINVDSRILGPLRLSASSSTGGGVDVYAYGYDSEGFPAPLPLGVSGEGEELVLDGLDGYRGFVLASRKVFGCDLSDSFTGAFDGLEIKVSS